MFKSAIAATLAGALTLSAAAHAGSSATLSYGDLDLSSDTGKAELSQRITRAARALCAQGVQTGTMLGGSTKAKCLADARAALAAQVARNAARTGLGG